MRTRSFLQMAGRAGRRGIDEHGFVYANVFPHEDDPKSVRRVMFGAVEDVTSQFNLSYATLLSLYSRVGEGIFDACKQSFAYFRHRKRKGAFYVEMVSLIRRRILLLQEQGYLEGQVLTPKGRFAQVIFGYEVELTELFVAGILAELEPPQLAILLTAIIFEAKRDTWFVELPRAELRVIQQPADKVIGAFIDRERDLKLPTRKKLDWSMSRIAKEWALGASFQQVTEMSDQNPGDIIRTFRMVLQLLRQLHKPLRFIDAPKAETERLEQLFWSTARCLRRGEVDAEAQLRRSVEIDDETEEPVGPAKPDPENRSGSD